jgi:hypothetical protein
VVERSGSRQQIVIDHMKQMLHRTTVAVAINENLTQYRYVSEVHRLMGCSFFLGIYMPNLHRRTI